MKYADELNREYADLIDYIHQNIADGDVIALEKYVKNKVNGSFADIIKKFLDDYESYENPIN